MAANNIAKTIRKKIAKQNKRYRENNREKIREHYRHRIATDPVFRLRQNLRFGLKRVINTRSKTKIIEKYLGCSPEELIEHIENQFSPGMSWDNYSYWTWHIDHIIPMATIKSEYDEEQIKVVCHYTNLQPLWAKENLKKGDKYEDSYCRSTVR